MNNVSSEILETLGLPLTRHDPETSQSKWKFLIHGFEKSGKTFLSATAEHDPRLAPCIFINREGGIKGIDTLPEPRPYIVDCDSHEKVMKVFWWLADMTQRGTNPFKTLIYDTYSEAHEQQIVAEAVKRTGKHSEEAVAKISQFEYTQANYKSRDIVKKFLNLDMHVIVTCHSGVREYKMGDTVVKTKIELGVGEGAQKPITRLFDVIGYLDIVKGKEVIDGKEVETEARMFDTRPNSRYLAGARGNAERIGVLYDAEMKDVMNRIEGKDL